MKSSGQASESLWRDRAFLLFWSGRAISLLGTAMTAVVFPLLVYRLTRSPVGAALGGVLAEQTTVRIALLLMAFGVALSLCLSWFSPLWQVQTPQGGEQEETLV